AGGAGPPARAGDRPRQLVEAASSGSLHQAVAHVPPQSQARVVDAAHQGFLAGFNDVLTLGSLLCFAGAVLALWLVRESEIEREPVSADGEKRAGPEGAAAPPSGGAGEPGAAPYAPAVP